MADGLIYKPGDSVVDGRCVEYREGGYSSHQEIPGVLIVNDRNYTSVLPYLKAKWENKELLMAEIRRELKYWKVVNGMLAVGMNDDEKNAVDQWVTDQEAQEEENKKDISVTFNRLFMAFALVCLDEINLLRNKAGWESRTVDQLRNAVKAKYETIS